MARKSYRRHSRRHTRGGSAPDPSSYSSGSSYGMAVNGPVDLQIKNSLTTSGSNGQSPSISSVGVQGQNVGIPANQMMKGGRRGKISRKRRGGLLGPLVNQAVVPLSILGMQQTYGRKKRGGRKNTRKRRGGLWGHVVNQAVVPLSILGMQQTYGKKKRA